MPSRDPHLVGRPRRRAIAECEARYPLVCHLCGNPIDPTLDRRTHPLAWTADELIPRAIGGSAYDVDLMRPAHRTCNSTRQERPLTPAVYAACRRAYARHAQARTRQGSRAW
jgi:hypothetical protein